MRTIAAAIALASSVAFAQEPLTFKGFELGAARSDFLAAFPEGQCKPDTCYWSTKHHCRNDDKCIKALIYGGVTPEAMLATFSEDRLVSIYLTFSSEQFAGLAAAMVARFGQPDDETNEAVQNRMGATFDNRRLSWIRGDSSLRITKRTSKLDRGTVSLTSLQYLKDKASERQEAAKARAKDL